MAVFRSCNLIAHKCREVISLSTPSNVYRGHVVHGRAKRVSLGVKLPYVEQGGVFRLASVVLSATTDAPRPLGRICRRTEPAPVGGVQRARV